MKPFSIITNYKSFNLFFVNISNIKFNPYLEISKEIFDFANKYSGEWVEVKFGINNKSDNIFFKLNIKENQINLILKAGEIVIKNSQEDIYNSLCH